jgi:aminomethyltransferase
MATSGTPDTAAPKRTPLYALHVAAGAKMVPFAGYEMPVSYPLGVLKEHPWTREKAGLFDVAHMGIGFLLGPDHATVAKALEALVPAAIQELAPGQQRYTQLLADDGGILDDLMVTRSPEPTSDGSLVLVVNAACKDADWAHIRARLPSAVKLHVADKRALVALQGPAAAKVLATHIPGVDGLGFMTGTFATLSGHTAFVTRSGYTGEDGYEIATPDAGAEAIWRLLASDSNVQPIGLGARDSLRLEAGLCLYGHDIDTTTSPIEAGLAWSIQKRRRSDGGFPGATGLQRELASGPSRRRVGIRPEGRAPAREGTEILSASGESVGKVTSGGFGPTVNGPIAMGYVIAAHASVGTKVQLVVRGKPLPAEVAAMPFAPHRYFRKG